MFTGLPFEIRHLIWEIVLHQPRVVYINMRPFSERILDNLAFDENYEPTYECLCSTPVPVLLHICAESRALALIHYKLTFGNANCPALRPPGVYHQGFRIKGIPYVTVIENDEVEVAKYSPKVYFNFRCDTVVFGRIVSLSPRGAYAESDNKNRAYFLFAKEEHFDSGIMRRIENLSLGIDVMKASLFHLNQQVGLGHFQRLKNLYFHLDSAAADD